MSRRTLRALSLTVALSALTVACGTTVEDVTGGIEDVASEVQSALPEVPGDGSAGDGGAPDQPPTDDGGADTGQAAPGSPDGATAGGEPPATGTDGNGNGQDTTARTPADDLGRVGANARALLRGDRRKLVVEVDVQAGQQADQQAVAHMAQQLLQHADKPGGVDFVGGNTFQSDRTEWTSADLRAVAQANRQTRTTDDAVSLYILYVDGAFHADGEQTSAIGVTYNASEIAIFPDRWAGLGALLGSDRAIERAVLTHELGHALGLVNLVYTSDIDHEDPEHRGHSKDQSSVMYWAIETTFINQVFTGPPPATFASADAADLEGLRTGRY